MLSATAKQAVNAAESDQRLSFLVFVHAGDELRSIAKIPDVKERRQKIGAMYSRLKKPVFMGVKRYAPDGLRIVDELIGSPNMILSGPAHVWMRMIEDDTALIRDPKLEIIPGDREFVAL